MQVGVAAIAGVVGLAELADGEVADPLREHEPLLQRRARRRIGEPLRHRPRRLEQREVAGRRLRVVADRAAARGQADAGAGQQRGRADARRGSRPRRARRVSRRGRHGVGARPRPGSRRSSARGRCRSAAGASARCRSCRRRPSFLHQTPRPLTTPGRARAPTTALQTMLPRSLKMRTRCAGGDAARSGVARRDLEHRLAFDRAQAGDVDEARVEEVARRRRDHRQRVAARELGGSPPIRSWRRSRERRRRGRRPGTCRSASESRLRRTAPRRCRA